MRRMCFDCSIDQVVIVWTIRVHACDIKSLAWVKSQRCEVLTSSSGVNMSPASISEPRVNAASRSYELHESSHVLQVVKELMEPQYILYAMLIDMI